MHALEAMRRRRSVGRLVEPAPTDEDLRTILTAATWAPDHERLRPWRFVVLRDGALDQFGEVLAEAYLFRCRAAGVEPTEGQLTKERTKLRRAPLVVVAGAVRADHLTVPWIEQQLAVGAAVQNAMIAATALGYGSMWRTGDPAYDAAVKAAAGLGGEDAIIGFLYLGSPAPGSPNEPHEPTDLEAVVTEWPTP